MEAHEDRFLSPITAAADRSEESEPTTILWHSPQRPVEALEANQLFWFAKIGNYFGFPPVLQQAFEDCAFPAPSALWLKNCS